MIRALAVGAGKGKEVWFGRQKLLSEEGGATTKGDQTCSVQPKQAAEVVKSGS